MVLEIPCANKKCEHYFEDGCTKLYETNEIHTSVDRVCKDFDYGINDGYRERAWYEKELAEVNEIKKQVAEITHDL